jgi:hypothetical protein
MSVFATKDALGCVLKLLELHSPGSETEKQDVHIEALKYGRIEMDMQVCSAWVRGAHQGLIKAG